MTRLGRGVGGAARWREHDFVSRGLRRPRKGALQNPAVLAARALAHARSARWRAVCFPEQATSARLAGGGACGARLPLTQRQLCAARETLSHAAGPATGRLREEWV